MTSIVTRSIYGSTLKHLFLFAVCMLFFPFNSHAQTITGNAFHQKKQLNTIIVDNYAPYTFVNQNGNPDGFTVDLIRAIAQEMGFDLNIHVNIWDRARDALIHGEIQVLPMMAYSKDRDRIFDFSVPHTIAYDAFFTRKSGSEISSFDDLRGKKIIVMTHDQAHDYLLSSGLVEPRQLILVDSLPEALKQLSSGKGDAALMPKLVGLVLAKELKLNNLALSPIVVEDYNRPFSFAVAEGNKAVLEKLSQGLSILKASGQYDNLYKKWFGTLKPPGFSLSTVLKYIGGRILGFMAIGSVLVLWTISLKRQVALRTRTLEQEIAERRQVEEALRKSEEKYRSILESIQDGYYEIDMDGHFTFFNDSLSRIYGYSAEELMGTNIRTATDQNGAEQGYQVFKRVYHSGQAEKGFEWTVIRKDGTKSVVEASVTLRRDADGKPIGFRGILRDISEKRRLEAQLVQAQKMEALGTLSGGIAHDFNNLLMAIQGRISIMLMDKDALHPDHEHLQLLEKHIESAANLTKQLLGFARGGKYEVRATDLNEIIKNQNRMFGRTKKEISIHGTYEKNLWTAEVDRGQMEQVLLNLYVNAWQAMPSGGDLYIQTQNVTLDEHYIKSYQVKLGNYVKISVTDTGVGMDKATQKKIFDPFFTTKEMSRGTGLGLASAYGIIKNHGGLINVYSEKGHGATFNIYLPASEKDVMEEEKSVGGPLGGSETVLFVDDEDIIIEIAVELLAHIGYKVLKAGSGKEAIAIYEANKDQIDIIILDMIMPNMSGGDTYDALKQINPRVKVVLSSGYSINGHATDILNRGCDGFIQKPFKMKELSEKLRGILDRK